MIPAFASCSSLTQLFSANSRRHEDRGELNREGTEGVSLQIALRKDVRSVYM